jgi:PAS domain S-box-containing protein
MPSIKKHLPERLTLILIGVWISAVSVLIVLNGPHYDFHELTLAFLLVFGCVLILGTSHLLSRRMRERDQAEELLWQSRERYSSLVEKSLMGIFISQDGVLRLSNPRFAETHGFAPEEIVGRTTLELTHPDDRPAAKAIIDRLTSGELQDQTSELRCLTHDGRTIWVQRRSCRILHEGRPAVLVNEMDITEQKLAAARLNEAHEQIKRLLGRVLRQQEVDRKQIASEIQENFAQSLSAIKMKLESLFAHLTSRKGSDAADSLAPIVADMQQTVESIRRLAGKLYPAAVDTFGLVAALRWLVDTRALSHPELRLRGHLEIEEALIPDDLKASAFRMVEKVLSGLARCAPSGAMTVYLQVFGSKVMLALKLDLPEECDFEDPPAMEDLDVADFRTRVESCGGQFSLSRRSQGARIWSSWPLPAPERLARDDFDLHPPSPAALSS